jgi:hypothetical protein
MKFLRPLCALPICAISIANGQQNGLHEHNRYVVAPSEPYLLVIASQPDCPIQFENAKALARIGGGGALSYQVRNRGTKAIKRFKPASVASGGASGSILDYPWRPSQGILMPGQVVNEDRFAIRDLETKESAIAAFPQVKQTKRNSLSNSAKISIGVAAIAAVTILVLVVSRQSEKRESQCRPRGIRGPCPPGCICTN